MTSLAQGSVLGPLLFNLFVNDITDNFNPLVRAKLFADDLKVYSEISVCSSFQFHLDLIHAWSTTWQLPISYSKCNILVLGNSSSNINFSFPSVIIKQAQIIRDLGVLVEPDLKFINHIHSIIDKANLRSSLVFRSFLSHNSSNLLRAYKTYIRPLLEYASSTWSPSLITQIMALEMVQKKFTKRIPDISDLNYKDRLHSLKLQSLEHRRLICDLVLCYKIVHNNLCMTFTDLFKFPNITSLRRHSLQLYCPVLKSNLHKGSFAYRVISPWNSLPENIVCAPNSVTFKNRLSKFDLSKFLIFPCIVWIDLLQWICFEKLFFIAQSCVAFQWFSMFFFQILNFVFLSSIMFLFGYMCASCLWLLLLYMHAEHFYNHLTTTSHNYFLEH